MRWCSNRTRGIMKAVPTDDPECTRCGYVNVSCSRREMRRSRECIHSVAQKVFHCWTRTHCDLGSKVLVLELAWSSARPCAKPCPNAASRKKGPLRRIGFLHRSEENKGRCDGPFASALRRRAGLQSRTSDVAAFRQRRSAGGHHGPCASTTSSRCRSSS